MYFNLEIKMIAFIFNFTFLYTKHFMISLNCLFYNLLHVFLFLGQYL